MTGMPPSVKHEIERTAERDVRRRGAVTIFRSTREPGVVKQQHSHPHRVVVHVLKGALTLLTASGEHALGPGDSYELEPERPHAEVAGPEGATLLIGLC